MLPLLLLGCLALLTPQTNSDHALQRALDSVRVTAIRADVEFLADEDMAGRETPSVELEITGNYLLNRVQRLGLTPGANGEWFQAYPLERRSLSTDSRVVLRHLTGSLELKPLDDYLWLSSAREPAVIEGPVLAVGDCDHDTLAALDDNALQGHWALASSRPVRLQSARRRLVAAGALGLLIVPPNTEQDIEREERSSMKTRARLNGGLRLALDPAPEPRGLNQLPIIQLRSNSNASVESALQALNLTLGNSPNLRVREERIAQNESLTARNLCVLLPGSDPTLASEVIVCSAHYDHVGVKKGKVYPGADDNASGTSGLLALAEAMQVRGPLRRSVLFLWVSGEEKGLWGSEAFCKSIPLPKGMRVVANVNIDMIGRTTPEDLYITPTNEHDAFSSFASLAYDMAPSEGFGPLKSQDEFYKASDHYNFAKLLKVPAVFLSTGDHDDYHKPTDTADKIDADKIARVVRLVVRMLDETDALKFPVKAPSDD